MIASRLSTRTVLRVHSSDLFSLVAEVYSLDIDEEKIQSLLIGEPASGSYFMADAVRQSARVNLDWSRNGERSIKLDDVFTDLCVMGVIDPGAYIVTHSW